MQLAAKALEIVKGSDSFAMWDAEQTLAAQRVAPKQQMSSPAPKTLEREYQKHEREGVMNCKELAGKLTEADTHRHGPIGTPTAHSSDGDTRVPIKSKATCISL